MKKLLLIAMAVLLTGCIEDERRDRGYVVSKSGKDEFAYSYKETVIDGCHYLYPANTSANVLTHKGNCPVERHGIAKPGSKGQGFVTDGGEFVDREQAAFIACKAGQLKRPLTARLELYSEDVW